MKTFFFLIFFWRPPVFGRKKPLNFGFRPKNQSQFQWRPFFFWRPPVFGRKKNLWISDFGRKISLNFSEDLFFFLIFFWRPPVFWAEKTFEFPSFPRNFVSIFGQTVWNWFKNYENSGQGHLHISHSFKIAPPHPPPPPFSKSWLRAWTDARITSQMNHTLMQKS